MRPDAAKVASVAQTAPKRDDERPLKPPAPAPTPAPAATPSLAGSDSAAGSVGVFLAIPSMLLLLLLSLQPCSRVGMRPALPLVPEKSLRVEGIF